MAIVSAIVDLVVSYMASQAVGVQYRFQVMGLLFASAIQFAVLLALIAAVGTLGGYRTAVRGAAIAAFAFGALLIILVPFYALDFLQSRRIVSQNNLKGFTLAGEKTGAFAGLIGLMLLWVGWRAFAASRRTDEKVEQRAKGQGLVVGQG
ncbi:MAG TPA: hypothetical protein VGM42_00420 [Rhodopila sp.]